jgi:hypothetical protein
VTGGVIMDIAGGRLGGAARYAAELCGYLARTGRQDAQVIGAGRHVSPAWLLRRGLCRPNAPRRIAVNNVSLVSPGGERWAPAAVREAAAHVQAGENA